LRLAFDGHVVQFSLGVERLLDVLVGGGGRIDFGAWSEVAAPCLNRPLSVVHQVHFQPRLFAIQF
jgi:hypothetical protein